MDLNSIKDESLKQILIEMNKEIEELKRPHTIHFAKVRENAIIPTKRTEDAGYDLYACFDEDVLIIPAHTTVLIPTGIATCFDNIFAFKLMERSSTSKKQMALRSGVIDSGFRGEIKACISNLNDVPIIISKMVNENGEPFASKDLPYVITCLSANGGTSDISKVFYENLLKEGIVYPYTKAIVQGVTIYISEMNSDEISYEELKNIPSERGFGEFGASGK